MNNVEFAELEGKIACFGLPIVRFKPKTAGMRSSLTLSHRPRVRPSEDARKPGQAAPWTSRRDS